MSSTHSGGPRNRFTTPAWIALFAVVGAIALIAILLALRPRETVLQATATPTATVVVVIATTIAPTAAAPVAVVATLAPAIPDCIEPFMPVYDVQVVNVVAATPPAAPTVAPAKALAAVSPAGDLLAYLPLDDDPGGDEPINLSDHPLETRLLGDYAWQPDELPMGARHALALLESGGVLTVTNPATDGYLRRSTPGRLVAMWIRPDDLTGSQTLYQEGSDTDGLRIAIEDARLIARVAGTSDGETARNEAGIPLEINAGEWHHVAVDYNYDAINLYLDGRLLLSHRGDPITLAGGEDVVAYMGGRPAAAGAVIDPYRGRLAEVRVYDSPSLLGFPTDLDGMPAATPIGPGQTATPESLAAQPTATATPATATTAPPTPTAPAATLVAPTATPQATTPQATAVAQAIAPVLTGTPPSFGIRIIPLFDLPFPYDGANSRFGGSAAQFFNAVQGAYNGGRITSYYDHQYPLYPPGFNGLEPEQYDGKMVAYSGVILDTVYSGHPGYDTAPFERHQATTPLFAAADGVIQTAAIHGDSGGYYVEIFHSVPGLGNFQSRYWHLEPDDFFESTRDRVGEFVTAGTRIGTIGNTGWSTGHHLHFEVRFDADTDGHFERNEIVDPFGFIPLSPFAPDPWLAGVEIVRDDQTFRIAGPASPYLWKHPLGTTAVMPDSGGGQVAIQALAMGGEGGATLCIPEESAPPGSAVNFSLIPDPPPSASLVGTGNGCVLSAFARDGQPVATFDPPVAVYLPFESGDLANIDRPRETLSIYWLNPDTGNYEPRPTVIDFELGLAYATLDRPGHCSLMGLPNRDLVAPLTTIGVDGPVVDGVFSDRVTVTLTAGDDQSLVEEIRYSLDNGDTWLPYEGPFSVPAEGLPLWPPATERLSDPEEGLVQGPGRYLVLAESRDSAGNVEIPPAARIIVIDPRLQMTPTPVTAATPILAVETCVRATNWLPYRIRSGDTWSSFVLLTNTPLDGLLRGNCLLPGETLLSIGQIILLPQSIETPAPPAPGGDTPTPGTPGRPGTPTVSPTTMPTPTPSLPPPSPFPTKCPPYPQPGHCWSGGVD